MKNYKYFILTKARKEQSKILKQLKAQKRRICITLKQTAIVHQKLLDQKIYAQYSMEYDWQMMVEKRRKVVEETEKLQFARDHYKLVWEEFNSLRREKMTAIRFYIATAERKRRTARVYSGRMLDALEIQDYQLSDRYLQDSRLHMEAHDQWKQKAKLLLDELDQAQAEAERQAPVISESDLKTAESLLERLERHYHDSESRYSRLEQEVIQLQSELDTLAQARRLVRTEYLRVRRNFREGNQS